MSVAKINMIQCEVQKLVKVLIAVHVAYYNLATKHWSLDISLCAILYLSHSATRNFMLPVPKIITPQKKLHFLTFLAQGNLEFPTHFRYLVVQYRAKINFLMFQEILPYTVPPGTFMVHEMLHSNSKKCQEMQLLKICSELACYLQLQV